MSQEKEPIPGCFDTKEQAAERLTEMFVGIGQEGRIKLGQSPAERAVFRKLHGVAFGRLVMERVFRPISRLAYSPMTVLQPGCVFPATRLPRRPTWPPRWESELNCLMFRDLKH